MDALSVVSIGKDVKLDPISLLLKLQTIKGVYRNGIVGDKGKPRHAFEIAMELMKQNRIQAEALVTYKFRLEDYRRMIAVNMNKGRHKAIKTIVAFQD